MSFKLKKYRGGAAPDLLTVIIDNSDVVNVGDAVQFRNGNLEVHTAGAAVAGVVVDIVDKNGNSLSPQLGSLGKLGSATRASTGAVTVASDNETVDLIAAKIEISKQAVFSATVTGTMNTTTSSNKGGGWVNADDKDSIDETTHSRTITDVRTWKNFGVDPDDSSRMLVSINHSEIYDNGAAMA